MIFKKLAAVICIFMLCITALPGQVSAAGKKDTNVAEVVLTSATPESEGFQIIEPGTDKSVLVASRGGESCWLMDKMQGANKSTINFTLSKQFKPEKFDGSIYDVEVDYFDSGKGYCRLVYINTDGDYERSNTIYTENTQVWKTAKFTLTNADFTGKANGKYDFYLSIKERSTKISISDESIGIRRVRVTRRPNVNKVYVSARVDEPGNTFKWFSENKTIHTTLNNLSGADANVQVTYRAITDSNFVKCEKTESVSIAKDGTTDIDVDFGEIDYCDIYRLEAEVKMSSGESFTQTPTKFAVIKTDPDGIRNEDVLFASHPDWRDNAVIPEGIEVMALSNVYGMRETISDKLVDVVAPILLENNLKLLPIYMGIPYNAKIDPTASNSWAEMPYTEKGFDGWRANVASWTTKLKDVVDRYEIWNEPNITSFNKYLAKCQGDVYTEVCRIAKEEIDKIDPGSILGGPSITGIQTTATWNQAGKPYFDDCMKNGMWKYVDAVVLHPYTNISAEEAGMIEHMKYYQNEFAKVGKPDAEVWNTETGYTTVDSKIGDEYTKGIYNCRAALLYKINRVSNMTVFYNFEKKGTIQIDREDQFGHVSPPFEDCKEWGTMYFPRESYLMVAGMNYIMAQSEADEKIDCGENINVFTYDSQKFGEKIVAMYCGDDKERTVSLKLGTDKIKLYDSKGNITELHGENGSYTFNLGGEPIYAVGDINSVTPEESKMIESSERTTSAVRGDTVTINLKKNTDKPLRVEVETPLSAELLDSGEFKDNSAQVKFINNGETGETYTMNLKIYDGENAVYTSTYRVTSHQPTTMSISVRMNGDDSDSWNAVAKITNISTNKALKGHIEFKSFDGSKKLNNMDIGIIPPQQTGEIEFGLGKLYRKGQYSVEYDIVTESGERYPGVSRFDISIAKYAENKPKIDGVIEKGEWDFNSAMYADKKDQVRQIMDWSGKNDISGKCIVMWDEDNMYVAADVTDNVFNPAAVGANQWQGDDIQLGVYYGSAGFLAIGQASTTYHEIGLALTPEGPQAWRWLSQDDAIPLGEVSDLELAVVNDGTKTYYEAAIPWKTLLKPGQQPKEGHEIAFSFLFNDNDGSGRRGWIEYTSGIGEIKNTELFSRLKLIK